MLRLSKKTEYALMAVKYIALKENCQCVTAKEISINYDIPFELVAKVLQSLAKNKLVISHQGVKGGYSLKLSPDKISLIDVISAIEPGYHITDCMKEGSTEADCARVNCCMIRDPLIKVQREIDKIFRNTTISNIL
jgi:Rrf2 family protein